MLFIAGVPRGDISSLAEDEWGTLGRPCFSCHWAHWSAAPCSSSKRRPRGSPVLKTGVSCIWELALFLFLATQLEGFRQNVSFVFSSRGVLPHLSLTICLRWLKGLGLRLTRRFSGYANTSLCLSVGLYRTAGTYYLPSLTALSMSIFVSVFIYFYYCIFWGVGCMKV